MKILKWTLGVLSGLLIASALLVFQPWSDYKPLDQLSAHSPERGADVFRAYDQHFAAQKVAASPAPRPFSGDPIQLSDDLTIPIMGQDRKLGELAEDVSALSIVVIRDGKLVAERFFDGSDDQTRFTSFSAMKSFTSTLVGMALHRGLIDSVKDRADKYVPEFAGTAYEGVTIEQLLQMSSGMGIDWLNPNLTEEEKQAGGDTNDIIGGAFLLAIRYSDRIPNYDRAKEPGTVFNYNNLDTQALAMILERVSGQPLYALLQDWLWRPLGMQDDASLTVHYHIGEPEACAFAGLNATTRDYAKLGRFMLEDGVLPSGERLVPEGWTKRATRPQAEHLRKGAPNLQWNGYGYQWWVYDADKGIYAAQGAFGQYIFVSEPDNVVIAMNSADFNQDYGGQADLFYGLTSWATSQGEL